MPTTAQGCCQEHTQDASRHAYTHTCTQTHTGEVAQPANPLCAGRDGPAVQHAANMQPTCKNSPNALAAKANLLLRCTSCRHACCTQLTHCLCCLCCFIEAAKRHPSATPVREKEHPHIANLQHPVLFAALFICRLPPGTSQQTGTVLLSAGVTVSGRCCKHICGTSCGVHCTAVGSQSQHTIHYVSCRSSHTPPSHSSTGCWHGQHTQDDTRSLAHRTE